MSSTARSSQMAVPAHAHFIWTGPGFGLCQRLAVESVLLTNPGYAVTLHLIEEDGEAARATGGPEIARLEERSGVSVRRRTAREVIERCDAAAGSDEGEALWRTYQRIPAKAASAKSNLLRYAILWEEGGIYLDLDVLVARSLDGLRAEECTLGTELVWRADEARVAGELAAWMLPSTAAFGVAIAMRRAEGLSGIALRPSWHRWLEARWSRAQPNNAVIAAAPRAAFVRALLERAPSVDATVRFRLGPTLVTEVARSSPGSVTLLSPEALYFVPPSQSFRFFHDAALQLPDEALLIHYVSSNHRRELGAVAKGGLAAIPPSLFRSLASKVEAGRAPLEGLA